MDIWLGLWLDIVYGTQVIKTFSMREGWWYIGIKGGGGVKSKGTRIVIEKEKRNRSILAACRHV